MAEVDAHYAFMEVAEKNIDIFDREKAFIDNFLTKSALITQL